MDITHIMRGEEWLPSVPKHVLLYQAFGWEMPIQAHLPNILDPSGKGKLSKRKKKLPGGREMLTFVHEFKREGYLPEAMVNYLSLVGWSYDGEREFFRRDELVDYFELAKVSKSPGTFSYEKLDHMNATYIRELGHNDLAGRLLRVLLDAGYETDFMSVLKFVPLVRERMKTLNDAIPALDFFFQETVSYDPALLIQKKTDKAQTLQALDASRQTLAALGTFDEPSIDTALRALAKELGLKVGQLLGSIRIACTGKKVAPPLFGTLDILGRELVLARLQEGHDLLAASA